MTPTQLSRVMSQTLRHAVAAGELPRSAAELPERVTLRNAPHDDADFASNLALRLAATTGRSAPRIAGVLRSRLAREPGIARVEVSGPGFLNITLCESAHASLVRQLIAAPHARAPRPLPEAPARDASRWSAITGCPLSYERRDHQPLFRVQYAHARCHALLTGARDLGFCPEVGGYGARAEIGLLALLADTERICASHGRTYGEPAEAGSLSALAPLARHLLSVADAFIDFQNTSDRPILPLGDEKPEAAHRSRLALAEATGTVLAGGLTQLGISAPNYL